METKRKIQDYLDLVCSQIRFREMHPQITLELRTHIEETIAAAQQEGMPPDDAIEQSIRQMGDPLSLGKQLDRTHKPRVEWSLLALSGIFIAIGLIDCGDLHLGFARVKCDDCQHEYLLPFSCKRRYFCPSTLRVPPVFAIAHQ